MINEIKGNALNVECNILAHQTNYFGVMGGGIAFQIRKQLLSKQNFDDYQKYCNELKENALGTMQILTIDSGKQIANLFGQYDWDTDYDALNKSMKLLEEYARTKTEHQTVVIPGYIGCGIAGGDWDIVYNEIIKPIFEKSSVNLTIVYFE